MQIEVKYLENLKLSAHFDDFKVLTDQPIRYKGDGTAWPLITFWRRVFFVRLILSKEMYCKAVFRLRIYLSNKIISLIPKTGTNRLLKFKLRFQLQYLRERSKASFDRLIDVPSKRRFNRALSLS